MSNRIEQHQQQSSRRSNNLLKLTITPAFPILISSDLALIKNNRSIQQQKRTPSILLAKEETSNATPENQSKVFSAENLFYDRLSLISSTSAESVNTASESEYDSRFVDQDKICLQFSNWLIHSMEENSWRELLKQIDFDNPKQLQNHFLYLSDAKQANQQLFQPTNTQLLNSEYQKREGNSIFYANSYQDIDGFVQMPSTSRAYDISQSGDAGIDKLEIGKTIIDTEDANFICCHNITDYKESHTMEITSTPNLHMERMNDNDSNNVNELISALADTMMFQNSVKREEMIKTFGPANEIQEMTYRNWKTPQKKFIFELHKRNDFLTQLLMQRHRCAGCGFKLNPVNAKRAQYCHYYSKLFCPCCHQGAKTRIPAQILHNWNFKEYPVCDAAFNFLTENEDQPVFNVKLINPNLYNQVKNLRRFRKLRFRIAHMWPFVQICRLAKELMTEHGILRTMFTSVPKRFLELECVDIYSLLDFECIANKNLIELLEPLLTHGQSHIESCQYCRQHAFYCQFCMDPLDLLFPFQLERCNRCDGCGSLSHIKCYNKVVESATKPDFLHVGEQQKNIQCNKCERIRKKRLKLLKCQSSDDACESE